MIEFLLLPLLAGLGIAAVAGPLGAFVVWRRMAYFGDTLAHASLMGVALGFILSINPNIAVVCGCSLLAFLLILLQQNRSIATDTLLGILSHSTLALGLIIVSLMPGQVLNLNAYLFGDLLSATKEDVLTVYLIGTAVLMAIFIYWRKLLAITVNEELANVEGVPVFKVKAILMLLMALVIAIAMKIVGVLLITALLIIPAATARRLAKSPESMAMLASLIACIAVIGGIAGSVFVDSPTGPSVVVTAAILFLISLTKSQLS